MTQNEMTLWNARTALRKGVIDWFQYFEIIRSLPIGVVDKFSEEKFTARVKGCNSASFSGKKVTNE